MNEPRSPKGDNDGKAVANTIHSLRAGFPSLGWPAEQLVPGRISYTPDAGVASERR